MNTNKIEVILMAAGAVALIVGTVELCVLLGILIYQIASK